MKVELRYPDFAKYQQANNNYDIAIIIDGEKAIYQVFVYSSNQSWSNHTDLVVNNKRFRIDTVLNLNFDNPQETIERFYKLLLLS